MSDASVEVSQAQFSLFEIMIQLDISEWKDTVEACYTYFIFISWGYYSFLWGPCFWLLVISTLYFKARVDLFSCILSHMPVMDPLGSALVPQLLSYWQPIWQLSTFYLIAFSSIGEIETCDTIGTLTELLRLDQLPVFIFRNIRGSMIPFRRSFCVSDLGNVNCRDRTTDISFRQENQTAYCSAQLF